MSDLRKTKKLNFYDFCDIIHIWNRHKGLFLHCKHGDVLHRQNEYFKKLQADFDPLSRKTGLKQKMLKEILALI